MALRKIGQRRIASEFDRLTSIQTEKNNFPDGFQKQSGKLSKSGK
jgi:hypothetical protein